MVAVDRKFDFEVVSPEKLVLSEPVDMAVIPGANGDFGVLAEHSLILSTLRPGVIDVWQGEQVTTRLFVSGGFAQVADGRCTILADQAILVSDIDATAAQADIDSLRVELGAVAGEALKSDLAAKLEIAEAKLAAAGRPLG